MARGIAWSASVMVGAAAGLAAAAARGRRGRRAQPAGGAVAPAIPVPGPVDASAGVASMAEPSLAEDPVAAIDAARERLRRNAEQRRAWEGGAS